jgi:hypothetical protein
MLGGLTLMTVYDRWRYVPVRARKPDAACIYPARP